MRGISSSESASFRVWSSHYWESETQNSLFAPYSAHFYSAQARFALRMNKIHAVIISNVSRHACPSRDVHISVSIFRRNNTTKIFQLLKYKTTEISKMTITEVKMTKIVIPDSIAITDRSILEDTDTIKHFYQHCHCLLESYLTRALLRTTSRR